MTMKIDTLREPSGYDGRFTLVLDTGEKLRVERSVVRLSFGPETTQEDIDSCVQAIRRHHDTRMPML